MKIQLLSDLHFEHLGVAGRYYLESIQPSNDIDALILAGDIAEKEFLNDVIANLAGKFPKIIMVAGNHEFYTSNQTAVLDNLYTLEAKHENFHFLNNDILEFNGKRFLGSTLWFPFVNHFKAFQWSDFHHITKFKDWVFKENDKAKHFFNKNLEPGDIVITHYLPSPKCIAEKFKNEWTNIFFLCDMEQLIEERKPAFWFHGHTHINVDAKVGDTRIIANPRGYIGKGETIEGNGFIEKLIIDI